MPSTPISILPDLLRDIIHPTPTPEIGDDDDVPGPRPYLPPLTSACPVLVEDGDLWSARKNFSAGHNLWRRRMVAHLQQNPELFPLLQQRTGGDPARIRALIDEEASTQQALTRMLQVLYPERDLGNQADPLDELIYIMISRRTREGAYQDVFRRLKARFAGWGEMAQAEVEEIHAITGTAGMGIQRAADLQQALHLIHAQFGSTADALHGWTDDRAEAFLTTLPASVEDRLLRAILRAGARRLPGGHPHPARHPRASASSARLDWTSRTLTTSAPRPSSPT